MPLAIKQEIGLHERFISDASVKELVFSDSIYRGRTRVGGGFYVGIV